MIEKIYTNLYIGDKKECDHIKENQAGWVVVHACKTCHRQLKGYKTRAAPQNDPEYLIARRDNEIYLNLIDANDPACIPKQIIDEALEFIHENLQAGYKVLVHCNLGESRSPAIGLLYLAKFTDRLPKRSLAEAEAAFRSRYPAYSPKDGMRGFLLANWKSYVK